MKRQICLYINEFVVKKPAKSPDCPPSYGDCPSVGGVGRSRSRIIHYYARPLGEERRRICHVFNDVVSIAACVHQKNVSIGRLIKHVVTTNR